MTDQALAEVCNSSSTEGGDRVFEFEEIRQAIARLGSGEDELSIDPKMLQTLQLMVTQLQKVWDKKGSFLEVGLSPFVQNLLLKLIQPEWASA
ncbi:MAG: hypothetical protein ACYTHM_04995 [Planctomycetota bacterium]|jgi:hypothetical protein